jgi:hypothetical protein
MMSGPCQRSVGLTVVMLLTVGKVKASGHHFRCRLQAWMASTTPPIYHATDAVLESRPAARTRQLADLWRCHRRNANQVEARGRSLSSRERSAAGSLIYLSLSLWFFLWYSQRSMHDPSMHCLLLLHWGPLLGLVVLLSFPVVAARR